MQTKPVSNPLFPVFLKLGSLDLLVVGGGNVALEKLTAIFENSPDARVKLVASEIFPQVMEFIRDRNIPFTERPFEPGDLENVQLALIAVNNKDSSRQIREECLKKNILVNVADTPDLCDFYLGSVVRKGELKLAISTNGRSPTIAKRVKEVLQEAFPDEINEVLGNMENIRSLLKGDFSEKVTELNRITAILSKKENPGG